jgi:hypothetical protein
MLLLSGLLTVAAAQPAHTPLRPRDMIIPGPTFHYTLKEDHSPLVCKHMLRVFNAKFVHPWDAPELVSRFNDPPYSAAGRYTFPRLPGVQHSISATFKMRFSAWPTSPEFTAIHWKEGRDINSRCPQGQSCTGEGATPILVAYFDFDNDGSADTVIKSAFNSDKYSTLDILEVWRGQGLKQSGALSLRALEHPQNKNLTPVVVSGLHLRPLIYRGMTYVASYKSHFAPTHGQEYEPSSDSIHPIREDMLVERYRFTGQKDRTGQPEWTAETVCDLRIKRLKN